MKGSWIVPVLLVALVGLVPVLIFSGLLVAIYSSPVRWEPPNLWSTQFGTTGPIILAKTIVYADANGLYAGREYIRAESGILLTQVFVSRYDLSHRQLWSQSLGNTTESNWINGIVEVSDGVYVAGLLNSTGFVRKYDLQGNGVWTDFLGSDLSSVDSVSAGSGGVFALGDYYRNSTNFNDTIALRSYDSSGDVLWTRTAGEALDVFAGSNGPYVLGSGFLQRYDPNGTLLWNRRLTCDCSSSGVSADETGIYVAGQSGDLVNAFVAKYDFGGSQVWMHLFRPQSTAVHDLSLSTDSSGVYIAFTSSDVARNYLSKYDSNGNNEWLFQIPLVPDAVSAGGNGVFVGGSNKPGSSAQTILSEFGQSSSLIFFGLNPPFSFLAIGLLVAATAISILWLRTRVRTRAGNLPRRVNR